MWWMNGSRSHRSPATLRQKSQCIGQPTERPDLPLPSKKRLRLPISQAQAAANRTLQETGVHAGHSAKQLRHDVRSLEVFIKRQIEYRKKIQHELKTLQDVVAEQQKKEEFKSADAQQQLASRERWFQDAAIECTRLAKDFLTDRLRYDEHNRECESWMREATLAQDELTNQLAESKQEAILRSQIITELELQIREQSNQHRSEIASCKQEHERDRDAIVEELHQAHGKLLGQAAKITSLERKLVESRKAQEMNLASAKKKYRVVSKTMQTKLDHVIGELDCALTEQHQANRLIEQLRKQHEQESKELQNQLDRANKERKNQRVKASQQRYRADLLKRMLDDNAKHDSKLFTKLFSLRTEIERQTKSLSDADESTKSGKACEKTPEHEYDELTDAYETNLKDYADLQQTHQVTVEESKKLISKNRELSVAVETLSVTNHRIIRQRDEQVKHMQERLDALNDSLQAKQTELQCHTDATDQNDKLLQERDALANQLQTVTTAAQKAQSAFSAELADFRAELKLRDQDLINAKNESERLFSELNQCNNELELQREANIQFAENLQDKSNDQIVELSRAYDAERQQRLIAERESQRLAVERSQRIAFLVRQRDQLMSEILQLRADVACAKTDSATVNGSMNDDQSQAA